VSQRATHKEIDIMINDKACALTEQIESSVNALAAETDAVRKSETFLNWLNAMAQFHSYSWNNQFLISIQCPGASKVAGFQTWKKLGRNVKKGAKGIAILAPCLYRGKADPENEDSPTVQKLGGFKVAYVFDYSVTGGEPLPALQYAAAAGGEDLLPKLEAAAGKLAVQLDYLDIQEQGVQGYSTGGRIVIRQSLSAASTCAVIAHELSHEILHQNENRSEAKTKTRSQRELEAEATAYVVMRHFGIEHVASNYLATYNVDGEQLRDSLETISRAAKRLIAAVEVDSQNMEATEKVAPDREENAA
jgi:antirestriction protein ArdC